MWLLIEGMVNSNEHCFLGFSGVQICFCLLLDVAVAIGMGDFRGTSLK